VTWSYNSWISSIVALSGYKIHQVSFEWKDDLTTNKQWVHTYVQAQTYSNLNKNLDYKGLEYLALQSNQIKMTI